MNALSLLALAVASSGSDIQKYCLAISSLTPKSGITEVPTAGLSGTPLLNNLTAFTVYGPFAVFCAIFIAVFGVFMIGRIRNWKMGATAFIVAISLASTPFILTAISRGTGSFVNAGPEEVPRTIRVLAATATNVLITWETDAEKIGGVRISPVPFDIKLSRTVIGNMGGATKSHTVSVDGLTLGKTYEFDILSGGRWYDNRGLRAIFIFRR